MKQCLFTNDDYCLRPESDYCNPTECKGCDHKNTHIKVISSVVTCETTVIVCDDCEKVLTEPKTN